MTTSSNSSQVAYFLDGNGTGPVGIDLQWGLGVLAGDTLRAAGDLGMSIVGISLAIEKATFTRPLTHKGIRQKSLPPGTPSECWSR